MEPPSIPDYELVRPIGAGSYGEVWLARSMTSVWRAVKVVRRDRFADPRPFERELAGITRFQQTVVGEPRQLALLHVGGLPEGGFYYVMELADDAGGREEIAPESYVPLTLKELLQRRSRLPGAEALRIAVDLGRALAALHARGLVHRDVKPSNIILVQGLPKLADLGLVASTEKTLTSVGTPSYLPPEGAGTPRADVFSLGKVLYELATGEPAGQFPVLPAAALSRPDRDLVLELNTICLRATEPEPAARYADAHELLQDLLGVQAGRSVRAYALLRARLRRIARASVLALGVSAALVATLATLAYRSENARRALAEEERRVAEYTADLRSAANALQLGDYGGGKRALTAHLPLPPGRDLRGFEWYALAQSFEDESVWSASTGGPGVQALSLSESGERLAVLGQDGRMRESARRGPLALLDVRLKALFATTSDGKRVLGRDEDGSVILTGVAGSGGKQLLAPAGYSATGWPGRWAVLVSAEAPPTFTRWDLEAGRRAVQLTAGGAWGERSFRFAGTDGPGTRVVGSFYQGDGITDRYFLGAWDLGAGQELWTAEFAHPIYYPRLSRDGEWVAFTEHLAGLAVSRVKTGEIRGRMPGHLSRVDALAFSPDAALLASGGGDQTVRIWDWRAGREVRRFLGCEGAITAIIWEREGRQVVVGSADGRVRRFDLDGPQPATTRRVRVLADGRLGDALLTPAGDRILVTTPDRVVGVYESSNLRWLGGCDALFQPVAALPSGEILGLGPDLSLRRQRPGNAAYDEVVKPFWPVTNAPLTMTRTSLDGSLLACVSEAGELGGFDLPAGGWRFQIRPEPAWLAAVDVSPDGRLVVAGGDSGIVHLIEGGAGQVRGRLATGHPIQTLALGPGQRTLAVARQDGLVEIWDPGAGRMLRELRGHSRYVYGIAFVDHGARMVTAGSDGKLIFWRVPDYRPMAELSWVDLAGTGGDQSPFVLTSDAAGRRLGLMTQDGWLHVWRRP